MKWRWAGHIARLTDDHWTLRSTEWQPSTNKKRRGRQRCRWRDELTSYRGAAWMQEAQNRRKWRMLKGVSYCRGWISLGKGKIIYYCDWWSIHPRVHYVFTSVEGSLVPHNKEKEFHFNLLTFHFFMHTGKRQIQNNYWQLFCLFCPFLLRVFFHLTISRYFVIFIK